VQACVVRCRGIVYLISRFKASALRITSNGSMSFVFETSTRGHSKRVTLGQFPLMTVALVRQKSLRSRRRSWRR